MTTATIFGKGNMGSAIAAIFTAGGVDVQQIDSGSGNTAVEGDIVVLAVPYSAFGDIVAAHGAKFAGKIVVDISNPIDFQTFRLAVPADGSAAGQLAEQLPDASVLKAFNTTFAATLASGTVGANPTTVLVAGDDEDAKAVLLQAVTDGGLQGIDAGALSAARELEAIGYLQLQLAIGEKVAFTGGFSVTK
ncbi:dinucleotide-binding protein [Rhodococcoides trifolii]|uniref:Dinucleotide-binding protein n=1 Tax=Rhodococcoides trifolii TaxID=908250 RepID=A0A917G7R7_9NOCA|nr:NAD(P)-binding domain-containing protein [Rhodococcus trifolii]GGG26608.1 dinucleotide-binding protein [Rhodococcus trifolii]